METEKHDPPRTARTPRVPVEADARLFPGPDDYFSLRLRRLAHLHLGEREATELWKGVERHRCDLENQLGRDVGQRVALLDFLVNIRRTRLGPPQIIARGALREIQRRATEDALTGLYNRHHFERELAGEWERCRRSGGYSSLLLIDLDRFKQVNDEHGHPVGDEVLRRVGRAIREQVRARDVPCRYGGDEFAVILPDTADREAIGVGERVLRAVSRAFAADSIGGRRLAVTASGGLAGTEPSVASAAEWVLHADRALLLAKRQRRLGNPEN